MKRLWSIFTEDMDHCFYTGSNVVERHHIFYGMGGEKRSYARNTAMLFRSARIYTRMECTPRNMPEQCLTCTLSRSASGILKPSTVPGMNL